MTTSDYVFFKNYYKMIAVDLNKQQTLDADPKAIQQVSFTGNLEQTGDTAMFSMLKEGKKIFCIFYNSIKDLS